MAEEYGYEADSQYDPCREWLMLLIAVVAGVVAIVAGYPIHLGVECYFHNIDIEGATLQQCKNIFNIEISVTLLVSSVIIEILMIALFLFACRHEFCGVKRKYKTSILLCKPCRRPSQSVYPEYTFETPDP